MNSLTKFIEKRKEKKPLLLMTHIICGYPNFENNLRELEIMENCGVDIVEIQFPFSEPIADGPLFSLANRQAIQQKTTTQQCLDFLDSIKGKFSFKILMMGYYNTVFCYGLEKFTTELKKLGVEGLIIADLNIDEGKKLYQLCNKNNLSLIQIMTPTNTPQRLNKIAKYSQGFIYVVARQGVTGYKTTLGEQTISFISQCRKETSLPLAVGFGISSKKDLDFLKDHADIAIIGSAILRTWEKEGAQGLTQFLQNLTN